MRQTRLVAGLEESSEVAFVGAHRSMSAWIDGDPAGGAEIARQAREMALRCGDARTAVTALVGLATIELRLDPDAGLALMLEAIAEAESTGFTEQHARALNNLGGFGLAPPHHAFADTYLPQAIEFCAAHNEDLWHINALAYAARNALDRGRWAEAADFADRVCCRTHASHPGRTTRRSSCSRSCEHGVAIRGRTLRSTRQSESASRRRTSECSSTSRARGPRSPGSSSAPPISTQATEGAACGRSRPRSCGRLRTHLVLAPARRSRGRGRARCHRRPCPRARRQVGGRRPPSGSAAPFPTRLRWR